MAKPAKPTLRPAPTLADAANKPVFNEKTSNFFEDFPTGVDYIEASNDFVEGVLADAEEARDAAATSETNAATSETNAQAAQAAAEAAQEGAETAQNSAEVAAAAAGAAAGLPTFVGNGGAFLRVLPDELGVEWSSVVPVAVDLPVSDQVAIDVQSADIFALTLSTEDTELSITSDPVPCDKSVLVNVETGYGPSAQGYEEFLTTESWTGASTVDRQAWWAEDETRIFLLSGTGSTDQIREFSVTTPGTFHGISLVQATNLPAGNQVLDSFCMVGSRLYGFAGSSSQISQYELAGSEDISTITHVADGTKNPRDFSTGTLNRSIVVSADGTKCAVFCQQNNNTTSRTYLMIADMSVPFDITTLSDFTEVNISSRTSARYGVLNRAGTRFIIFDDTNDRVYSGVLDTPFGLTGSQTLEGQSPSYNGPGNVNSTLSPQGDRVTSKDGSTSYLNRSCTRVPTFTLPSNCEFANGTDLSTAGRYNLDLISTDGVNFYLG